MMFTQNSPVPLTIRPPVVKQTEAHRFLVELFLCQLPQTHEKGFAWSRRSSDRKKGLHADLYASLYQSLQGRVYPTLEMAESQLLK
jgi:hypothetical protein